MIDSCIRTVKNKETIVHYSIPHILFWISFVSKLILKKNDLSIMPYRIVLSEHMEGYFCLSLMIECHFWFLTYWLSYKLIDLGLLKIDWIVNRFQGGDSPFVRCAECPVKGLFNSFEILYLAHILLLPNVAALDLNLWGLQIHWI